MASRCSRGAAWSRSPDLVKGDDIVATIVSQGPPEVVTEQEVQATLAQSSAKTEAPATKSEPTPATAESSAVAAAPRPRRYPVDCRGALSAGSAESSGLGTGWYVLILVVIVAVLFLVMRRRKDGAGLVDVVPPLQRVRRRPRGAFDG